MKTGQIPRIKKLDYLDNPLESEITEQITNFLDLLPDCTYRKIHGHLGQKLMLDLVICYKGKYYELEVKRKNNKPSQKQIDRIVEVKNSGGISGLVYSLEDVIKILNIDNLHKYTLF